MGKVTEFLKEFFSEEENYLPGAEPVKLEGRTLIPYSAEKDPEAVWPNAHCSRCSRLALKKSMYFDPGAGTFFHPACLPVPKGGKGTK